MLALCSLVHEGWHIQSLENDLQIAPLLDQVWGGSHELDRLESSNPDRKLNRPRSILDTFEAGIDADTSTTVSPCMLGRGEDYEGLSVCLFVHTHLLKG